jgi:hypothetical protein
VDRCQVDGTPLLNTCFVQDCNVKMGIHLSQNKSCIYSGTKLQAAAIFKARMPLRFSCLIYFANALGTEELIVLNLKISSIILIIGSRPYVLTHIFIKLLISCNGLLIRVYFLNLRKHLREKNVINDN